MTAPAIIRTRFAPSPSGHLHVGGARTALFCWAFARKRGGKFILRIEDTDAKRSSDAASMAFLDDLKWLGITWDEGPEFQGCGGGPSGPYLQSQRGDIYDKYFEQLIAQGKAYPAFETPAELDAARKAAQAQKINYRYDRAALKLSHGDITQHLAEGRPHVVRFRVPDECERVVVHDEVRGEVIVERSELDDFVIRKADRSPMYNFAVVVDDELMGVTHVIRAQEHLSNTPKHILLQDALGFRRPVYAHISLITNPDGSKMSKRDKDKALRAAVKHRGITSPPLHDASAARSPGIAMPGRHVIDDAIWKWWLSDKDHQLDLNDAEKLADAMQIDLPEINVDDFRRRGYLPEVMINYLALLGWNPGGDIEKFDAQFLIDRFDFDRVIKTPAKFDRDKLLAFNLDALQAMSDEEFTSRLREHCTQYHPEFIARLNEEQFAMLAKANHSRSKTLDDQIRSSRFFIMNDDEIVYEQSKAVQDALIGGTSVSPVQMSGYHHLEALLPVLRGVGDWTVENIEAAVKQYAAAAGSAGGAGGKGIKLGVVAQPLRIAVSGGTVSPAIFDTLAILGRDSTLKRIERCLAHRETLTKA